MDNYFEFRQIMTIIRRWWWIMLAVILLALLTGYFVNQNQTPEYEASVTVMVGDPLQSSKINRDDIAAQTEYTQAYAEMARRQPVLEGAVKTLGLDLSWRQLSDTLGVLIVEDTSLIEISVRASSPKNAEMLAEEIANQLILLGQTPEEESAQQQFVQQEIDDLQTRIDAGHERLALLRSQVNYVRSPERLDELKSEIDTLERIVTDWEDTYSRLLPLSASNSSQNGLTVIEEAHANSIPVSPRLTLNLLLSFCIGLVLAIGLILLIDHLDTRIRTSEAIQEKLGLNYLGTISKMRGKNQDDKLIGVNNPQFDTALYYKKVLDNIGFSEKGDQPIKSLLVTSSHLREGKTTTASNLGVMMAHAGYKTVIVDADWKNPTQHLLFDLPNEQGLMDLLTSSDLAPKELTNTTSVANLQILTIGNLSENPFELLQPAKVKTILSNLAEVSDVVIIDAPSANIAESATLYSLVDGVILVIEAGRTTVSSVRQTVSSVHLTGGKLLGGILNRSPSPRNI